MVSRNNKVKDVYRRYRKKLLNKQGVVGVMLSGNVIEVHTVDDTYCKDIPRIVENVRVRCRAIGVIRIS